MTTKKTFRVVATGARILTGAAVAAACVIGVTTAVATTWPTFTSTPASVAVTPSTGDTQVVCDGSFRALGRDATQADQMAAAADPQLRVGASEGKPEEAAIEMPDLVGGAGAKSVTKVADEGTSPRVAASESFSLAAEDLSGLASAACRPALTESWLVGGSVMTGTNDLIVLTNPGQVTADVTLKVHGTALSASTVLVPAGTQKALPLASIAAGEQSPVVKVTSEGSPVRATLQSSLMRTLDPAGADLQDSAGTPQAELTFAGVQVVAKGIDVDSTVIRLLAPGANTEAAVEVTAVGKKDPAKTVSTPLAADVPSVLSLDGLETGVYTVTVRSAVPVVGAVWQTSGFGGGSDFAWMTPAPLLDQDELIALPALGDPRVHLVNAGETEADVTLTDVASKATRTVTVPAHSSVVEKGTAGAVWAVSSSERVRAAVLIRQGTGIAGWPLWSSAGALRPVTVYP